MDFAADARGADAQAVDGGKGVFFDLGVAGVRVMGAHGPGGHALGHEGGGLKIAADAHAQDHGRAGIGPGFPGGFDNKVPDARFPFGGGAHFHGAHVFAAEALGNG